MATKRKAKQEDLRKSSVENDHDSSVLGGMKGGFRSNGSEPGSHEPNVKSFSIHFNDKQIICERHGSASKPSLIFTHGAGGGIANPATSDLAKGFAEVASVTLFQGTMNLQSRVKTFDAVIEHEGIDEVLGGRSMGARAATISAAKEGRTTKALLLVSYPLLGGKNGEEREQVLLDLDEKIGVLFVVGSNDAQCPLERLEKVRSKMSAKSWLLTVEGADHGMSWKPKELVQDMRRLTGKLAAEWVTFRDESKRRRWVFLDAENHALGDSGWTAAAPLTAQDVGDDERPPKKRKRGKGS